MNDTTQKQSIPNGGPAFPVVEHGHPTPIILQGMTLRDWFAGQALAGLCESGVEYNYSETDIAAVCWQLADAMLVERAQPVEEDTP